MQPLFLGNFGATEILVILLIVVLLFGGKKIPEMMRGMGRGVREFKDAMDGKTPAEDEKTASQDKATKSDEEKK